MLSANLVQCLARKMFDKCLLNSIYEYLRNWFIVREGYVTFLSQAERLGVVTCTCNPSYLGCRDGRIVVRGQLQQKVRPYLKEQPRCGGTFL
jgi:hypothetical protein